MSVTKVERYLALAMTEYRMTKGKAKKVFNNSPENKVFCELLSEDKVVVFNEPDIYESTYENLDYKFYLLTGFGELELEQMREERKRKRIKLYFDKTAIGKR